MEKEKKKINIEIAGTEDFDLLAEYNPYPSPSPPSSRPKLLLNPAEVFTIIRLLGQGDYGEVYKIKGKITNSYYALKVLNYCDPTLLDDEVRILKKISKYPHCDPNIVCYYDTFATDLIYPGGKRKRVFLYLDRIY